VPILTGLVEDAALPPESYDAITLWDSIEHIRQPLAVLREMGRLLKPGGVLGLSTPNIRSLLYRLLGRHCWFLGPQEHIYYYDRQLLRRVLAPLGFVVVKSFTNGIHTIGLPSRELAPFPRRELVQLLSRRPFHKLVARSGWGDELFLYARKR